MKRGRDKEVRMRMSMREDDKSNILDRIFTTVVYYFLELIEVRGVSTAKKQWVAYLRR
jgi:hypothetical protein